jgi:uncharacterized damage-inducible protein DinB
MDEIGHIKENLSRALEGPAWHGPALMELLRGVSAKQAAAHPIQGAHSIWEIVLHCIAWHRAVTKRLQGEIIELEGEADWPPVKARDERAWQDCLGELNQSTQELLMELDSFTVQRLDDMAPGKDYSYSVMLHGLVGHDLYHAGQIALLKKGV